MPNTWSNDAYVRYLKNSGIKIGEQTVFYNLKEKVNIMVLHHNIHIKLQKERKEVLLAHIGVPLYDEMKEFALSLLERIQAGADDASVIQRILSDFNRELNRNISSQFDHEEKTLFP